MSRTVRRKNFEKTYRPHNNGYSGGGKIAGFYTEWDLVSDENSRPGGFTYVYREPTAEERFDRYKLAHGDKLCHTMQSISKDERKIEEHSARARNRAQLAFVVCGLKDQVVISKGPKIDPPCWW